MKKARSCFP